jgi:hypothetical protein
MNYRPDLGELPDNEEPTTGDRLGTAIRAPDAIACDWEHMKRKDMVLRAGEALCEIGAWRKAKPGEFCRHGVAYTPNDRLAKIRKAIAGGAE